MNQILVTGGNGLVGSCFDEKKFDRITSKHGDLRDPEFISRLINNSSYDGIIHCAATVGGIGGNMKNQGKYFYDNIMMNTLLIEEARKRGIQKLILFSSTCVFPDRTDYPLTPEKIHLGPPHDSNYGYAYAKRMSIVQTRAYNEQYGLKYFCVIPCNIYGPGDNFNLDDGHVIPSLIHRMYLAQIHGHDFVVWGSGNPLREFIFSRDVAALTKKLYDSYTGSDPVILSSSVEISIREVVFIIAEIFGYKGKITFDFEKPDGQLRKPSDNSVIKRMFPDFKFTPIIEGLSETISWFIKNYPNIRK